jgi:phenylpropionate dioxygenase-like ring-hydroxylating dioxygenase large terminal subunit
MGKATTMHEASPGPGSGPRNGAGAVRAPLLARGHPVTYDVSVRSPVPQPPGGLPALANTSRVWRRSWIAVARAAEVPDNTPVQVLLGGDAWVLTRMDGVLTAFDDHCPHQQSPLSAGSVTRAEDGSPRLSCAFHGWRFDPAGQCDLMPDAGRDGHAHHGARGGHRHHRWHARHAGHGHEAERAGPGLAARLRAAHGVVERYGLVWLAAEEPLAPLPEFPEWEDDAAGRAACPSVTVPAGAGQVIDGFLGAEAGEVAVQQWRVTGSWQAENRDGGRAAIGRAVKTAGPHATAHLRLELPHATIGILVTCQPEDWGTTRVHKLISHSGLASGSAAMEQFTRHESQLLAGTLAAPGGLAAMALPLDPQAVAPRPHPGPLNIEWRRLMARAAALPG